MIISRTRLLLSAANLGAMIYLAGCDAPVSETGKAEARPRPALVTASFTASSRVEGLLFLPDAGTPWSGLVVASLARGGLEIFNIDGVSLTVSEGPRLRGLAGVSDFALRGETFPLIFGVDETGALRGYAIIPQTREAVEIPLGSHADAIPATGVCLYSDGIGYIELAILSKSAQVRILRVRDTGATDLTLTEQNRHPLPFPARSCASTGADLLVTGPSAGLARVNDEGETLAFSQRLSVSDVVYTELLGRPAALVASVESGLVSVYDARTLDQIVDVQFESGLNAPAFERPSTIAITEVNYGGMAFSSGVMAVYDEADAQIKLVAREVISRVVVEEKAS